AVIRLAQEMAASITFSRNGNILRLTGPTPLIDTSAGGMNLVEFSDFYGRSMHTGGSERVPMLTFPEAEGNSPAFVLVSARWFLQHVGNEEMVRIAVAAIDADVDQKFQTRIAMKNPVQRADL